MACCSRVGKIVPFEHCCSSDLERALDRQEEMGRVGVLTDGLFSLSGRVAPLREYTRILPHSALILVDDAHSLGVAGREWARIPGIFRIRSKGVHPNGKFSESIRSLWRHCGWQKELRDAIWSNSSAFAGSTPLPLPVVQVCLHSLTTLRKKGRALRQKLQENVCYLKKGLAAGGLALHGDPTPVFSLVPSSISDAVRLQKALRKAGDLSTARSLSGRTCTRAFSIRDFHGT